MHTIHSSLAADQDLAEIVDMFVDEMPQKIDALLARLAQADWQGLERAAHQLKGAAGSYGFEQVTEAAGRLEGAVRRGNSDSEVRSALRELVELCRRVRPGPAESSLDDRRREHLI